MKNYSSQDKMVFYAEDIPSYRTQKAIHNKVQNDILLSTWGGIGDQVCAEPTLRYAFKFFKNCRISLESDFPELFSHLPFEQVFNKSKGEIANRDNFLPFNMIERPPHIAWEFISHALINCVDYPSLNAFRMQLPQSEKEIFLTSKKPNDSILTLLDKKYSKCVFVHPGKHWQSKTFPKTWWDSVLRELLKLQVLPVIIGSDVLVTSSKRGTVDVETKYCIDLRNKLSIQETVWLLQRAKVLLTNDSAPMHLAASRDPFDDITGTCWIGYIATCKHPEYITHWRDGKFQHREINHSKGGIWEYSNNCPNQDEEVLIHECDPKILESWLPDPASYAKWAAEKF